MRDDIELKPLAEELGFEAKAGNKGFWKEGVPYDAYSFVKGNVHVWQVRAGLEDALNKANPIFENA